MADVPDSIAALKNYTMSLNSGFFNYSDGSVATVASDYGLPILNEETYVDENTIYTYDNDSGAAFGSTIEEGKAYNFNNIVDDAATTVITKTEDTEATEVTDIYAYASTSVVTTLSTDGLFTNLNVTSKSTDEDGTIIAEGTGEDDNAFIIAILGFNTGVDLSEFFEQAAYTDGSTVADNTDWSVTIGEESLNVQLSWNVDGTAAYILGFDFTDFGTTTVPLLTDDVVLPVVA